MNKQDGEQGLSRSVGDNDSDNATFALSTMTTSHVESPKEDRMKELTVHVDRSNDSDTGAPYWMWGLYYAGTGDLIYDSSPDSYESAQAARDAGQQALGERLGGVEL